MVSGSYSPQKIKAFLNAKKCFGKWAEFENIIALASKMDVQFDDPGYLRVSFVLNGSRCP